MEAFMVLSSSSPATVQSIATNSTHHRPELNVSHALLRAFVVTAVARTFGEAASAQRLTVSAVSQQMKALERQLRLKLFERVGRNARLTADGRHLLSRLQPLQQLIDEAVAELQVRHANVAGSVAIGSPRAFGAKWLRPRLASLLKRHEALAVSVDFDVPSVLERRLAESALDLCILVRPSLLPGIATEPIATETFVAVASPAYVRHLKALDAERYIVFDDDLPMHAAWWRAQFGRAAAQTARIVARVASLDEMRALAQAGSGIAVLPDYFLEGEGGQGLVRLGTKARPAKNTLFLAWREHAVETARFLAAREALRR
jgi:DNA-binding transcriptional LysR family regulator